MALTEYQNRNQNDILVSINFQYTKENGKKQRKKKLHGFVDFEYVNISAESLALIFKPQHWFKFCAEKI